ncbi:MAG: dTDP-4-dehydrorhamnose 3,5-epimerase family protein [Acidimicrobiales bacterium]
MRFIETPVAGVCIVELDPIEDARGSFARAFATDQMREAGLFDTVVHVNISTNETPGTLRGMHWQDEPCPDPKIVRCTRGAIFDVAVDLRPDSPTYLSWTGQRLDAETRKSLHVPAGCAHGFITLEPGSDVLYLMGAPFEPDLARGIRWDDPAVGVDWPLPPAVISQRDASYPDLPVLPDLPHPSP